jgi:hypothetical protein
MMDTSSRSLVMNSDTPFGHEYGEGVKLSEIFKDEIQYPDIQDVQYSKFSSVKEYVQYSSTHHDVGLLKAKMLAKQQVIRMLQKELEDMMKEYEALNEK